MFSISLTLHQRAELLVHVVTLTFWKTCQTVFQSACNILHSHQQCRKAVISPHPRQYILQLTLEWDRFEAHGSTYTQILFNSKHYSTICDWLSLYGEPRQKAEYKVICRFLTEAAGTPNCQIVRVNCTIFFFFLVILVNMKWYYDSDLHFSND